MEYALVGWPEDDPRLRLDHRQFGYAGKFVMTNTGKVVAREPPDAGDGRGGSAPETDGDPDPESEGGPDGVDDVVAAVAFDEDRTDPATARLRYVTVRADRRGEAIGPRLVRFAVAELRDRGYDRVVIAVNNPFAYHALYKAGFGYTGDRTGLAELVLAHPSDRSPEYYRAGMAAYRERDDLAPEESAFVEAHVDGQPPDVVALPE